MDELAKVAKECPSEGKAQDQEGAWQCRWHGMTEEVKREAESLWRWPRLGKTLTAVAVSAWPPAWFILKWAGIEVKLSLSNRFNRWEHCFNCDA